MKTKTLVIRYARIVVILGSLLTALSVGNRAVEAQGDGHIEGKVINQTTGQPVPDIQVTLSRFENNPPELINETSTVTSNDGSYAFDNLDASQGVVYVVSIEFQNVLYSTGMIRLWENPDQQLDVAVYEATADQSALRLQSRGIVLSSVDAENGRVAVLDVFAFSLPDPHTIVPGDDGRTLRFSVPGNATNVTTLAGFDFGTASIEGTTVYATSAITPGNPSATLGYTIPYQGSTLSIDVAANYPTDAVRILVPVPTNDMPEQISVEASGAEDGGEVTIGDRNYHLWTMPPVAADGRISIRLSGLPRFAPQENELPRTAPIVLAAIALLAAVAVTGWLVVKRELYRPRPVALAPALAVPMEERRDELAGQLRALETARAADEIEQNEYTRARRAILEELRWLSRQARGVGADE